MYRLWFVAACMGLLVLFVLITVASEAIDTTAKNYVRDAAKSGSGSYGRVENATWSVLVRLTGTSANGIILGLFALLGWWQWTFTAYNLGTGWQVAYVVLGSFVLWVTLEFEKPGSTVVLVQWVVAIEVFLMIVHVAGIGLGVDGFTIPLP